MAPSRSHPPGQRELTSSLSSNAHNPRSRKAPPDSSNNAEELSPSLAKRRKQNTALHQVPNDSTFSDPSTSNLRSSGPMSSDSSQMSMNTFSRSMHLEHPTQPHLDRRQSNSFVFALQTQDDLSADPNPNPLTSKTYPYHLSESGSHGMRQITDERSNQTEPLAVDSELTRRQRQRKRDAGASDRVETVDDNDAERREDEEIAGGELSIRSTRMKPQPHPEARFLDIKETLFKPKLHFSFDKSDQPSSVFRKNRVVQSCTTCRRRKTKCDRKFPCGPCTARSEEATCEEYQKQEWDKPTGYTHVNDTIALANRVNELERVVSLLLERVDKPEAYRHILNFGVRLESFDQETGNLSDNKLDEPVLPDAGLLDALSYGLDENNNGFDDGALDGDDAKDADDLDADGDEDENSDGDGSGVGNGHNHRVRVIPPEHDSNALDDQVDRSPKHQEQLPQQHRHSHVRFGLQPLIEQGKILDEQRNNSSLPTAALVDHIPDVGSNISHYEGDFRNYHQTGESGYSKPPSVTEHEAALTLEDMALGRGTAIERSQAGKATDQSTFSSSISRAKVSLPTSHNEHDEAYRESAAEEMPGLDSLPKPLEANYIIRYFFQKIHRLMRVLHVSEFQGHARAFQFRTHKSPLSIDDVRFVSLYSAVLTMALHVMDDDSLSELGYTSELVRTRCADWAKLAHCALDRSDWMQRHDIMSLQTVVVLSPYLWATGRTEAAWVMIGTVNKVATNLGLSRLGPEITFVSAEADRLRYGPRWASRTKREIGRRVWYYFLEMDWLLGLEHNFSTCFHEDQNRTAEPANIDDDDLRDDVSVVSKPMDVYTDMSYVLQKTRLVYPMQRLLRQINSSNRLRYSSIQDAHAELVAVTNNLPPFYRLKGDASLHVHDSRQLHDCLIERSMINTMANLHLMRVHRLYLSQAYANQRYVLSREICISSAEFVIDAGIDRQKRKDFDSKYWGWAYGTFTATVILMREYAHSTGDSEPTQVLEHIHKGLDVLRQFRGLGNFSKIAHTLDKLLEDQRTRRAQARLQRASSDSRASQTLGASSMVPGTNRTLAAPNWSEGSERNRKDSSSGAHDAMSPTTLSIRQQQQQPSRSGYPAEGSSASTPSQSKEGGGGLDYLGTMMGVGIGGSNSLFGFPGEIFPFSPSGLGLGSVPGPSSGMNDNGDYQVDSTFDWARELYLLEENPGFQEFFR